MKSFREGRIGLKKLLQKACLRRIIQRGIRKRRPVLRTLPVLKSAPARHSEPAGNLAVDTEKRTGRPGAICSDFRSEFKAPKTPPSHGLTGLVAIKEVANKTVFCRVQAAFERALNPVERARKVCAGRVARCEFVAFETCLCSNDSVLTFKNGSLRQATSRLIPGRGYARFRSVMAGVAAAGGPGANGAVAARELWL